MSHGEGTGSDVERQLEEMAGHLRREVFPGLELAAVRRLVDASMEPAPEAEEDDEGLEVLTADGSLKTVRLYRFNNLRLNWWKLLSEALPAALGLARSDNAPDVALSGLRLLVALARLPLVEVGEKEAKVVAALWIWLQPEERTNEILLEDLYKEVEGDLDAAECQRILRRFDKELGIVTHLGDRVRLEDRLVLR